MENSKVATISLQLDSENVEISIGEVSTTLEILEKAVLDIGTKITDTIDLILSRVRTFTAEIKTMMQPIKSLSTSLDTIVGWDVSGVVAGLNNITTALNDLKGQIEEQQSQDLWTSLISSAIAGMQLGQSIYDTEVNRPKGKYESGKTTIFGSNNGKYLAGNSAAQQGLVSGTTGFGGMDDDLIVGLSSLIGLLTQCTAAWAANTAAKITSMAEDIAILSPYAVDYIKAFGGMIAKVATSTATWVANTAVKVASTAAEWAQIAATTAWTAICTAATAVTTALGAAFTFLTSPIGLAILAIAAIIAIGVLLYKNWDTICVKAKEVWAFVQSKFQEFDTFLQNVFAKDWTEQFGVIGHVFNAFFQNIENVWNAIKTIFSGIVTFISGVFSGDWKKAWSGITQIFTGIWEGLQAAIKCPINGIIGIINGLVSGVTSGLNAAINAINKLKFNVPDWVPIIGGKSIGFNIATITAPQIPYLAQGAVLPANKPFLAVVGDQRHGTNVEAPLETIQEAVAVVMNDQVAAMMAGFEAVVRAINDKNTTLELDGREIWNSYNAYNRKAYTFVIISFRKLWSRGSVQGFLKRIARTGRIVIGLMQYWEYTRCGKEEKVMRI